MNMPIAISQPKIYTPPLATLPQGSAANDASNAKNTNDTRDTTAPAMLAASPGGRPRPQPRPVPRTPQAPIPIPQRVLELNRSVRSAPLTLPNLKPGQVAAPQLPSTLSKVLKPAERVWTGVPAGAKLNDKAVEGQINSFLSKNNLARGMPSNWTAAQRNEFASMVVQLGLDAQSSPANAAQLGQNLQAVLTLVKRSSTQLPSLADSALDTAVNTTALAQPPSAPAAGTTPANPAQTLQRSILQGAINAKLASPDAKTSRAAYETAFAEMQKLNLPAGDQRVITATLDRQYLGYVGQREAALQASAGQALAAQLTKELQAEPEESRPALRNAGNALLAASRDVSNLNVASEMLRNDQRNPPVLASLKVPLSNRTTTVNRASIEQTLSQANQRLKSAQQAWKTIAVKSPVQAPTETAEPPKKAEKWKNAAGKLSNALGANVNPFLQDIEADIKSGKISVKPYDFAANDEKKSLIRGEVGVVLAGRGVPKDKVSAMTDGVMQIAEARNIDAKRLAIEITGRVADARKLVASVDSRNPLLVDSRSPESVAKAKQYFRALYSLGQAIPQRTITVDGREVTLPEKTRLTRTMTDLDGVLAGSYGEYGVEIALTGRDGKKSGVYLPLGKALPGAPTEVLGVTKTLDSQAVVINIKFREGETNKFVTKAIEVPVSKEQAKLLEDSTSSKVTTVAGLTARRFPPEAMQLLRAASDQDGRGAQFPGGVISNLIEGNTFGTAGITASEERPGELVRSIERSNPSGITAYPIGKGFPQVPNFRVYSGGSSVTENGVTQEPFGFDPKDAEGIKNVAGKLTNMVDVLGKKYGLSAEQMSDWKKLNFTNADIPSIILPESVVGELLKRGATPNGNGLRDLQRDIEAQVTKLIADNKIGDKFKIHHTASQGNDELKLAEFDNDGKLTGRLTTEWQINVKGGKALPVLDSLARTLKSDHGIDLIADLQAKGFDYSRIRKMELPEVLTFFKEVVRPMIDAQESQLGYKLTGKMVVQADTYGEKRDANGVKIRGQRAGSDLSLIDAARALYGDKEVTIVQVDTLGGKTDPLRQPEFKMSIGSDGKPVLTDSSVYPETEASPGVYVGNPATLGGVLLDAYQGQSPLPSPAVKKTVP